MKQAVKGKKEKKKKLRRDKEEEDNQLIDSFVQKDRDDQFVAACALTNMLKGKERKTMSKRGRVTAKQAKKWNDCCSCTIINGGEVLTTGVLHPRRDSSNY
jgi:hypothetical protein